MHLQPQETLSDRGASRRLADSRLAGMRRSGQSGEMPKWLKRWFARIPRWESHIAFAEWIWRGVSATGVLAVGWWTAARAWAEGAIGGWGTLGYVAVILSVALALSTVFALLGFGVSKWRIRNASVRTSQQQGPAVAGNNNGTDDLTDVDPDAQDDLSHFVIDFVIPLGLAHERVQNAVIEKSSTNSAVTRLASQSIMSNESVRGFGDHFEHLRQAFCGSPSEEIPFEELKGRVLAMDKNYGAVIDQTYRLAQYSGLDC
jgi:hypothetical protein